MQLIVDNTKKVSITKNHLVTILASLMQTSWNKEQSCMTDEEHEEILEVIELMTGLLEDDPIKATALNMQITEAIKKGELDD